MFNARITSVILGAAAVSALGAAETVKLSAERVALFKNGYSQVSLEGELPGGKELELKGLPVPVEGTLWWSLPQGAKAVQVTGSISEREVPAADYTTAELLAANIGKKVRLVLLNGVAEPICLEGVLESRPLPPAAQLTYTNHGGSERQQQLSEQAPVFLKMDGKYVDVDLSRLEYVEFVESPATPMRSEMQPQLTMQLAEPAPGGKMRVECLAAGLSWNPSYRLDLRENDRAQLECQAIIRNDMVDLEHTHLELITGQPDLGGDGLPNSPLCRLDSVKDWDSLAKSRSRANRASVVAAPVMMEYEDDDCADESSRDGSVTRTQELYHFAIPDFSAKKNSTVAREIYTQTTSCHHVYTCAISAGMVEEDAPVWHCLRLKNESTWPWSPGTVVCCSGGRLLARVTLGATAPGQESLLRLALTPEVQVSPQEKLVDSKLRTAKGQDAPQGDDEEDDPFADDASGSEKEVLLTYQGKIMLRNNAAQAIDLELAKSIPGRVTEAGQGGEVRAYPVRRNATPTSRILWKLRLAPGESKECTYTYTAISR